MFQVGEKLYNLTERDRSTLYVDSFFRSATVTIAALSDTGEALLAVPLDRALYINNFTLIGDGVALSTWTTLSIRAVSDAGVVYRLGTFLSAALVGDNASTSGAGVNVVINRLLGLIIPPNTKSISLSAARSGNTNAATATIAISGFLLPPGGIGRLA
jgi:hypothetical protein